MIYEYYTDGAATIKKVNGEYVREAGGWAFAQVKDNKLIFSASGYTDNTTNNAMELTAIHQALRHYITRYYSPENYDTIKIYSDSAYCVNMLKKDGWVYSWSRNSWTRGKKHESIENLDLIKKIFEILSKLREGFGEVEFIKVAGHSGNKFNEVVDKLAVEAKSAAMGLGIQKKEDFDYVPYAAENSLGSPELFAIVKKIRGNRAKVGVIDDIGPDRETVEKVLKEE